MWRQFSVQQKKTAKKSKLKYLFATKSTVMSCPKIMRLQWLKKVKIFSSDATVVAAGSAGQLERGVSQGPPHVTSEGTSSPVGTTANHHMAKKKKKNSFLLMLKHTKERETQLLNNTSYNIVCTLLCIEHFLLPIKKTTQSLEKWRHFFEARRASIDNCQRDPTQSHWPDIERESTENFAVESPQQQQQHKITPKIFYQWYNLHNNAEMTIFLPIFVCLVKTFLLLIMIQKVSQSYPNARGVKGPNSRDVWVEVLFDGKGASVQTGGQWINSRSGDGWILQCLSTFFLQNVWPPQQRNSQTGKYQRYRKSPLETHLEKAATQNCAQRKK